MITVEEYLARVLALAEDAPRHLETVPVTAASGRVLGVDVSAAVSVPPVDNSAMDGFAVRAADLAAVPVSLAVLGESAAVAGPIPPVVAGGSVRVMTGGRLPRLVSPPEAASPAVGSAGAYRAQQQAIMEAAFRPD